MMWICLAVMAVLYFLLMNRRNAVMLIVLPLAVTGFISVVNHEIIGIICDKKGFKSMLAPIGALALSLVITIPILVTLISFCVAPVKRREFGGNNIQYELECAKRRLNLLKVSVPILWAALIVMVIYGTIVAGAVALTSLGAMVTPMLWVLFIGTLGFGVLIYARYAIITIQTEIQLFMDSAALTGILLLLSVILTGMFLHSIRKITGKPEKNRFLKIISVIVPVWGYFTIKDLSKRLEEISAG